MSISSLTETGMASPSSNYLMERHSHDCAEFGREYEVAVESWAYDSYGLPLLDRQTLYRGYDTEQAHVCFHLAVAASKHRACRVILCYTLAASEEGACDSATDWDLGG